MSSAMPIAVNRKNVGSSYQSISLSFSFDEIDFNLVAIDVVAKIRQQDKYSSSTACISSLMPSPLQWAPCIQLANI